MGIYLRTLKRRREALIGDGGGHDQRKGSPRLVVPLNCNKAEYVSLSPGQIVPALADQVIYIG